MSNNQLAVLENRQERSITVYTVQPVDSTLLLGLGFTSAARLQCTHTPAPVHRTQADKEIFTMENIYLIIGPRSGSPCIVALPRSGLAQLLVWLGS